MPTENYKPNMMPVAAAVNAIGKALLALFSSAVIAAIIIRATGINASVVLADIQQYAFAGMIPLAIVAAFISDKNVRAQLIKPPDRLGGAAGFETLWLAVGVVLPMTAISFLAFSDVISSWQFLEGSREHGGLPGYFLVKSILPVSLALMTILAMIRIRRAINSVNR